MHPFLLFTDLDGTLLDHYTYEASISTLKTIADLKKADVPIIFCSSKTFAEQVYYQQKLGIFAPFVIENGSAVCIPEGYFPNCGFAPQEKHKGFDLYIISNAKAQEIQKALSQIEIKTGFKTKVFAQVSDNTLNLATGLSGLSLSRARNRWFTETLLSPMADELYAADILQKELIPFNLTLIKGGRFWTVQSNFSDKGIALNWLSGLFAQQFPRKILTVAIGDSANDISMLQAANHAFLVQKSNGQWAEMEIPGLQRISKSGSAGFSEAAQTMLNIHKTARA